MKVSKKWLWQINSQRIAILLLFKPSLQRRRRKFIWLFKMVPSMIKLKRQYLGHTVIPEVHRQKFRSHVKSDKETYMDHAYNLNILFMKCLVGKNCFDDLNTLKQVLLLERFFETLPEAIKLWLDYKQPATLDEAARPICS